MLTSNNNFVCENKAELGSLESFLWEDISTGKVSTEDLSQSYSKNAYILIRSFFDSNGVTELRDNYSSQLTSPVDSNYGVGEHPAAEFVKSKSFLSFTSNNHLRGLAAGLLGGEVISLKRKILRTYEKGSKISSPAHRDIEYFPEGTDQILTAWIPLGDCPVETGGILYLEGSHSMDWGHVDFSSKKWISRDLNKLVKECGSRWLASDFKAGDIILHSPYIVHSTLDCNTSNKRISTDFRFAKKGEKSDWRWDDFWQANDGY